MGNHVVEDVSLIDDVFKTANGSIYVANKDIKSLLGLTTVEEHLFLGSEFSTLSLDSTCKVERVLGNLEVRFSAVNKYPNLTKVGGNLIIEAHNLPIPRSVQFGYLVINYVGPRGMHMHKALSHETYLATLDRITKCPLTELISIRDEGILEKTLADLRLSGNLEGV